MSMSVTTSNNINIVSVQDAANQIAVINNSQEQTVVVPNNVTTVVEVFTGPQGQKGDQGETGPTGPSGSVDTGSLVTTASFNSFTSSFNTGSFTGSFTGSILASNFANSGNTSIGAVQENLVLIDGTSSPSMSFDFSSGSIFYLTNQTNTTTWNITNLPTTSPKATTLTFIIEQGATAYSASAYQLNGTSVSVKWPQGVVPTGSANVVDAIGLTAFYVNSSWTVLGSFTPFS